MASEREAVLKALNSPNKSNIKLWNEDLQGGMDTCTITQLYQPSPQFSFNPLHDWPAPPGGYHYQALGCIGPASMSAQFSGR